MCDADPLPLPLQVRHPDELGDTAAMVRMLPTHMPAMHVPRPVEPCELCGCIGDCGCVI